MENDKLKSIALVAGSIVLLFITATNPGFQRDAIWRASSAPSDTVSAAPSEKTPVYAGIVSRNTSFFDLMLKCGLDAPSIHLIEKAARNVYDLRKLRVGQRYQVYAGDDGSIERMQLSVGDTSYIDINIRDASAEKKDYEFTTTLRTASATITKSANSLFLACRQQGIPLEVFDQLANDIFAWDIDFHQDIQQGDYFRIIYEERTRFDGLKKMGGVRAAEFYTAGRSHYAFLFRNEYGRADYYDENGKSLRKALLRAPLPFSARVSSGFSSRRWHPILHHYAPHLGVDYAAPYGTPVLATGDGSVIETGRKGGNGRYVKLRHPNGYITYYLHLSRFAKGVVPGAHVRQGQTIAYVGSSGYSTGPHLDYRIMKGNVFVNPRKVSLPPAKPVTSANMAAFIDLRDRHLARLSILRVDDGTALASKPASVGPERTTPIEKSAPAVSH